MKMAAFSCLWVLVLVIVPTPGLRLGGPTNTNTRIGGPCNVTDTTFTKFIALHKMGTYLHAAGGQCFEEYFWRQNMAAAVWTRETECAGPYRNLLKSYTEVHWTREPLDWVVSQYLFHKRGNEPIPSYLEWLRVPENFRKLQALRPSIPTPLANETTYTNYLQRVSEEDGLASELFRLSADHPKTTSLKVLVQESKSTAHSFSVCLEDFMQGHSKFLETWHMILKKIKGGNGDAELDECLADCDVSLRSFAEMHGHPTLYSVTAQDHARMHRLISKLDDAMFHGLYANASKEIGCEKMSVETLAKLNTRGSLLHIDLF